MVRTRYPPGARPQYTMQSAWGLGSERSSITIPYHSMHDMSDSLGKTIRAHETRWHQPLKVLKKRAMIISSWIQYLTSFFA